MKKLWKIATGIEVIGAALLLLIIIPAAIDWVKVQRDERAQFQIERQDQKILIDDLQQKVETLSTEDTAEGIVNGILRAIQAN